MSEWKMDPALLSTALSDTTTAFESLTGVFTEEKITTIFGGLTWGGGVTACVSQALDEVLAEQQSINMTTISNHVAAGIYGVGNAARALQEGQEDMAATFQTEMVGSAGDGDFTYFEQYGYQGE